MQCWAWQQPGSTGSRNSTLPSSEPRRSVRVQESPKKQEFDAFSWFRSAVAGEEPQLTPPQTPSTPLSTRRSARLLAIDTRRFHSIPELDPRWELGRLPSRPKRPEAGADADDVLRRVAAVERRLAEQRGERRKGSAPPSPFLRALQYDTAASAAAAAVAASGGAPDSASARPKGGSGSGSASGSARGRQMSSSASNPSKPDARTPRSRNGTPRSRSGTPRSARSGGGEGNSCSNGGSFRAPAAAPGTANRAGSFRKRADDQMVRTLVENNGRPMSRALGHRAAQGEVALPQSFKAAAAEEVMRRVKHLKAAQQAAALQAGGGPQAGGRRSSTSSPASLRSGSPAGVRPPRDATAVRV